MNLQLRVTASGGTGTMVMEMLNEAGERLCMRCSRRLVAIYAAGNVTDPHWCCLICDNGQTG